ncbi:MAG: M6 family metalloprotease domain-containing protein [Proteobacteria bacterium]|nr:M6 family metalloprotease domain-containing protein [Pseudomonadota bacterium]
MILSACANESDSTQNIIITPSKSTCDPPEIPSSQLSFVAEGDSSSDIPLLVIMVEFTDATFDSCTEVWQQKIFGSQDGQLNHYFDEISSEKFHFVAASETDGSSDGIVSVTLSYPHLNPYKIETSVQIINLIKIISDTMEKANSDVNFSTFDTTADGNIERSELQVMFLLAGYEAAFGAVTKSVWAHKHFVNGVSYDGVTLLQNNGNGYSMFGERHGDHDATIGVIGHELGHAAFNLPDLYDIDLTSEGIGKFGLMAAGSWTGKIGDIYPGSTPTHMSAWSKIQTGFATPVDITMGTNASYSLYPTNSMDYNILKIPTMTPNEYFLIESRPGLGYDQGLDTLEGLAGSAFAGGVAIWHIDDNQTSNANEARKWVDLEEASGDSMDDENNKGHVNNLFFDGNKTSFSDSTNPNSESYAGTASNLNLSNITTTGLNVCYGVSCNP